MAQDDSKDFKTLRRIWYKKIATTPDENGKVFRDIEDTERDNSPLISWHNHRFKNIPIDQRIATELYYSKASDLLNYYNFQNETHRIIWELHCEGFSRRKIAFKIKLCTPTYNQSRIGEILLEISKEFKKD